MSFATVSAFIDGKELSVLINSRSSASYINHDTALQLGLLVVPSEQNVSMALSTLKSVGVGYCKEDLTVKGRTYSRVRLGVLKNVCSDILLGGDFQSQHRRVIFEYDSKGSDFIVENR